MRYWSLLIPVMVALTSCQFGGNAQKQDAPDIFEDTIAYTVEKFHQRGPDCSDKADSACTVVSVKYPVFKGQDALNDTIVSKLTGIFVMQGKPDTSIALMAKNFLKSYTDFKKSDPTSVMYYTMDTYVKVISQDSALIALEYGGYSFQGGAHGASFTGFINWDPDTKKAVYLKDILVENYKAPLNKIAEGIFRKNEKLKDTSTLARDYFFKDNKFALNENYLITPIGIRFMYNQYEIKPYAAGQTELILIWDTIRGLVKPNAIVAPYVKKDAGI